MTHYDRCMTGLAPASHAPLASASNPPPIKCACREVDASLYASRATRPSSLDAAPALPSSLLACFHASFALAFPLPLALPFTPPFILPLALHFVAPFTLSFVPTPSQRPLLWPATLALPFPSSTGGDKTYLPSVFPPFSLNQLVKDSYLHSVPFHSLPATLPPSQKKKRGPSSRFLTEVHHVTLRLAACLRRALAFPRH